MRYYKFGYQDLIRVLCFRAEVYTVLGRGEDALSDLGRAWGLAPNLKDYGSRQRLQLDCLRRKSKVFDFQGRYPEMREAGERALEVSLSLRDREGEGEFLNQIGRVFFYQGDYGRAMDYYQRALTIRHEIGDRQGEASSLNNMGSVRYYLGDHNQALDCYHRALEIRREIGDARGEAASLNNIGAVYYLLRACDRALDYYHRSLAIVHEIGERWGEAGSLNNIGRIYGQLGEYEQSLNYYQRALKILQEIGGRQTEGVCLVSMGSAYEALGVHERALDCFQRSLTLGRELGDRRGEAEALSHIGDALSEMGSFREAEDVYLNGEKLSKEIGYKDFWAYCLAGLASLYVMRKDLPLADQRIGQLMTLAEELESKYHRGAALCLQGRLQTLRGEGTPAQSSFQGSLALFKDLREELDLGKACFYFGQGLRALGEQNGSDWYLVQAKEIFTRLKARGWLSRIEKLQESQAREYGVNTS